MEKTEGECVQSETNNAKTKALKTMKEQRLKTKAGLMDRKFTEENKKISKD